MLMITAGCDGLDIDTRYLIVQTIVERSHAFVGGNPSGALNPHMRLTPLAQWRAVCQSLAMTRDVARSDTDVTTDGATRWSIAEHAAYATASAIALCKHAVVSIDDVMVRRCSCWVVHALSQLFVAPSLRLEQGQRRLRTCTTTHAKLPSGASAVK